MTAQTLILGSHGRVVCDKGHVILQCRCIHTDKTDTIVSHEKYCKDEKVTQDVFNEKHVATLIGGTKHIGTLGDCLCRCIRCLDPETKKCICPDCIHNDESMTETIKSKFTLDPDIITDLIVKFVTYATTAPETVKIPPIPSKPATSFIKSYLDGHKQGALDVIAMIKETLNYPEEWSKEKLLDFIKSTEEMIREIK